MLLQSNCSSMLLQSREIVPHSCSPKLLFKVAATESRVPKKLPKIPARSCLKAGPESCPKLLPKAASQSCSPALLPKVVPQSCSPKLLPQSCDSANLFTKTAPQNHSAKRLPKVAPESCAPKLLPKVASQSCCPKLVRQYCDSSNLFPKTAPHSYSAKWLPKAAPESCYRKLLHEVVCVQPDRNIGISSNKVRTCRYTLRLALRGSATVNSHAVHTKGTATGLT